MYTHRKLRFLRKKPFSFKQKTPRQQIQKDQRNSKNYSNMQQKGVYELSPANIKIHSLGEIPDILELESKDDKQKLPKIITNRSSQDRNMQPILSSRKKKKIVRKFFIFFTRLGKFTLCWNQGFNM